MSVRSLDREGRDRLDRAVAAIDWDEDACRFGSPERMRVAAWAADSGLVEGEMRRLFPDPEQRAVMCEFTGPRIMEKIVGVAVVTNPNLWNPGNLWDPRRATSFCGWLRRTATAVARANPARVLHGRTRPVSAWDDEEGNNPIMDGAPRPMPVSGNVETAALFDREPDLRVMRPCDPAWSRRWARTARTDAAAMGVLRRRLVKDGYWHRSLDRLDTDVACALLLAPVPERRAMILPAAFPDGVWRDAAHAYWPTQTGRRHVAESYAAARAAVERVALCEGRFEWHVWTELGTAMARLLAD
ncbi:hypothetical protein [Bifidobacterium castoris]|uniref:Uncharacterized protein n=1 Tax=Bifidobacterium castoris TaxID=2306972 RepID=A0A430FAJ4_9BIFI|nr:hypothetical protein [Bifidobacterium castoris]RSX49846.1 hypothetical protein D2E22_0307 [Bifidobacterium castoris]